MENKLFSLLPLDEDINEVVEMSENFDMASVRKALGDETFATIMSIALSLESTDNRLLLLGSLDKLMYTNVSDLVKFPPGTVFRIDAIMDDIEDTVQSMVDIRIHANMHAIHKELPEAQALNITYSLVRLLNIVSTMGMMSEEEPEFDSESANTIVEAINTVGVKELYDNLYKFDKALADDDEEAVKFFENVLNLKTNDEALLMFIKHLKRY